LYAGVELGGTKCVAMLARGPDNIVARETVQTTAPDETIGAIERILSSWYGEPYAALGIASFGPLDLKGGRITNTPKPAGAGRRWLSGCSPPLECRRRSIRM
jgi:fructokinase